MTIESGWRSGAVPVPSDPRLIQFVADAERRFPILGRHRRALKSVGSQFVYASACKVHGFDECWVALARFSGAIESAFGLTREVLCFYSPYRDLQIRTFHAVRATFASLPREATPDLALVWSPDLRLREKLDDWSTSRFLAVPFDVPELDSVDDEAVALLSLLREYIYTRDLYYETTPVEGERFFGRRRLLQSLREDLRAQRVVGVFGLRKAGKTSVLAELARTAPGDTVMLLRDLEVLPSPPDDPIPDLLADLRNDLLDEFRGLGTRTKELVDLTTPYSIPDFRRALLVCLRYAAKQDLRVVLALDEVEYLVPSDRVDVEEGDMASVAQFFGALRSLVQESNNFTFIVSGLTSALIECGRLYGRPNPLFAWAKSYYLGPFSRSEADDLALALGHRMGLDLDDGALAALHEATGGHAFLYRHLASAVVQTLPIDVMRRTVRRATVLHALEKWRRSVSGNVVEMVSHLRRYYPDEAFLLDLLRDSEKDFIEMAESAPAAVEHLLQLGLILQDKNHFELTPILGFGRK